MHDVAMHEHRAEKIKIYRQRRRVVLNFRSMAESNREVPAGPLISMPEVTSFGTSEKAYVNESFPPNCCSSKNTRMLMPMKA